MCLSKRACVCECVCVCVCVCMCMCVCVYLSACVSRENILRKLFQVSSLHSSGLKPSKNSVGYHRNFISLTDHTVTKKKLNKKIQTKRITRISTSSQYPLIFLVSLVVFPPFIRYFDIHFRSLSLNLSVLLLVFCFSYFLIF